MVRSLLDPVHRRSAYQSDSSLFLPFAEAKTYSLANADLQSFALTLHAEVMQLRALLAQLGGQHLPDVDGYLAREAEGGGIPTILAIAGTTLQTDYVRTLEA